ncbi:hypothetical protein D1N78_19515, partial [Clostridioides difficile]
MIPLFFNVASLRHTSFLKTQAHLLKIYFHILILVLLLIYFFFSVFVFIHYGLPFILEKASTPLCKNFYFHVAITVLLFIPKYLAIYCTLYLVIII